MIARYLPNEMGPPHRRATSGAPASGSWLRITALNHRFDKVGNRLPLELHGCGCGLCARQQRALRSTCGVPAPKAGGQ